MGNKPILTIHEIGDLTSKVPSGLPLWQKPPIFQRAHYANHGSWQGDFRNDSLR